jgi:hypothetical protein
MNAAPGKMSQGCRAKLGDRHKLWKTAHEEYKMEFPETWSELYDVVSNHPHRWSILTYIGVFLLVSPLSLNRHFSFINI